MLKQIYRSAPFQYFTRQTYTGGFLLGLDYHANVSPWIEKLYSMLGVFVWPTQTLNGETCVYLQVGMNASYWPSWSIGLEQFDGVTGQYITRVPIPSNIGTGSMGGVFRSTGGRLWIKDFWSDTITPYTFDEKGYHDAGPGIFYSFFQGNSGYGSCAINESSDVFLNTFGGGAELDSWQFSTGKFLMKVTMPHFIRAICMEDDNHVYLLLANRILILWDYQQAAVLGAARIPAPPGGHDIASGDVVMTWDYVYRRVLIAEKTPDNVDGSSTTCVRGYRLVPQPTRITTPIPLKAPRKGRTIPVLASILGDMNEGVGGYLVSSVVTGDGAIVGIPITDNQGRGVSQVACGVKSGAVTTPTQPLTTVVAPVIGRNLYFGYFFQFSAQYGDNPTAPSNTAFVNDAQSVANAVAAGKKLIVGGNDAIQASIDYATQVIGVYVAGSDVDTLSAAAASQKANLPTQLSGKLIIGNWDGGSHTLPPGPIPNVDVLAIECYVGATETAAACETRVRACLTAMPGQPVILIGQAYTSNTDNTEDPDTLMAAQLIPASIAKDFPQVRGILYFSDGRPTGTRDHEEWRPLQQAVFDGLSGAATTVGQISGGTLPPGSIKIVCSVTLPLDPAGVVPSGTTVTTPDTGGGTSDSGQTNVLTPMAPNRMDILQQVLASQTWHLNLGDAYDQTQPDGRGGFTEAAVKALHAVDPNWGEIKKNPGQNQYNGHAVDAIIWKDPDGVTAEIYDILDGSGNLQWNFSSRGEGELSLWYF